MAGKQRIGPIRDESYQFKLGQIIRDINRDPRCPSKFRENDIKSILQIISEKVVNPLDLTQPPFYTFLKRNWRVTEELEGEK